MNKGGVNMGSCDYIGLFMDFNIYRITETDEESGNTIITYNAKEVGGIDGYRAGQLEAIIIQIIKHNYLSNPYHNFLIDNEYKELKKELKGLY